MPVPVSELAKLFPLDLDRAFAKLDKIKPQIAVWWKTGAQSQQVMRQGDAVMSLMWSGTAYATKKSGVPLDWSWTNAVADFGSWTILKGAPHPNAARLFQNWMHSREGQQLLVDYARQYSPHSQTVEKPGVRKLADIKLMTEDPEGILTQADDVKKRYAEIFKV